MLDVLCRGTEVSADAEMSIEAGGEELLSPVKLDMELHLPKVLRTLLATWRRLTLMLAA